VGVGGGADLGGSGQAIAIRWVWKQRQQLPNMYVATKVAPILAHQLKSQHSRNNSQKLKNLSRFPPIKV